MPSGFRFPWGTAWCRWSCLCPSPILGLLYSQHLDLKGEGGVRRYDASGSPGSIAQRRRNNEPALAADPHRADAFVPSLDHLTHADLELERLAVLVRTVELRSVLQSSYIVY